MEYIISSTGLHEDDDNDSIQLKCVFSYKQRFEDIGRFLPTFTPSILGQIFKYGLAITFCFSKRYFI